LTSLRKISLTQFRNYTFASFAFLQKITCIAGPNGSGKTALLDAVYYLCYTKSYFSAQQQHTAQNGTDGFRVEGEFAGRDTPQTITCKWRAGKKEIQANGIEYERPADHIGRYAAVMIAPDDMELINNGSELRRKWMDGILSQTDRQYLEALLQYSRVLLQRNGWLKMEATQPSTNGHALDYYNSQLAYCGAYLYQCRKQFLAQFMPLLQHYYAQLSASREAVDITYTSDLHEHPLDALLKSGLQQDLRMQRTLRGTHKDDLQFTLAVMPLKQFGSQGQKKSFLFALKLAQYAYLSKYMGQYPILLLDDIFEKLDQERMEALLRIIQGADFGQVILTDTHAGRVQEAFGPRAEIGFIRL
jgi:DNA replication and repair protein RecF